jgi:beta-glucosidase
MKVFPRHFIWGAATSSYQVEGENIRADWWQWEKSVGIEKSGAACRHYQLYEQDFDLAKSLHHNAHRLSIEWSRIEPEEGKFSEEALEHYRQVIRALKSRNIEPFVTLHHFTNPEWFTRLGGWEKRKAVDYFLRYCGFLVPALAKDVHYWITINEPTIYISHAYLFGFWPPQKKSILKVKAVEGNFIQAHLKAYRLIHATYRRVGEKSPAVSISQHMQAYIPCRENIVNRFAASLRHRWFNCGFIDVFTRSKTLDFIGLNYYSRQLVEVKKLGIRHLLMGACEDNCYPVKKNSLGWDIYPQGIYDVLVKLKKYKLPIIVTENGICTLDDKERWDFIRVHLEHIHRAMEAGVDVRGYLYWSLMDNFEWDKGFTPRFGLIDIDYKTFQRTVRESARLFARACETGIVE